MRYTLILVFTVMLMMSCKTDENKSEAADIANEFVPQWAKEAVWYQIFPERFRDGDPNNNPKREDIKGADPQEMPRYWKVHPWGSDWYELADYEKKNGEPELWKHILRRRYGGDLQGIIDQLDYLQDLGITAIYLNPVFQSPSHHKYDAESYHHIDPNFGPDPEGDRAMIAKENPLDTCTWVWTSADELALKLIDEVHKRGMRIIFDGVFNHMGKNSFAFKDVEEKQQKSEYKDWFIIKSWKDNKARTSFDYEGWFGVKSLPEFREDSAGIVAGPKSYIFNATRRWMNPKNKGVAYGIDGWRLDVAFCIGHPFWKEWRKLVKSINPEAYLTAEIVDVPEKVKPYMQGDEFDGEMNYNFAFTCAEFFFNPDTMRINTGEFDQKLKELRDLYPEGVAYVCQNLFGSHDANRIGSHIVNRGIGNFRDWGTYFTISRPQGNPNYSSRKPTEEDLKLQKLFVFFQMTYVGAPMIYYGDEVGMWGGNDPDCRKPMVWADLKYSDEVYNADGTTHEPEKVEVNKDLYAFYKKMIGIRNANPCLRKGSYRTIIADNEHDLFIFERSLNDQKLIVSINNGKEEQTLVLDELKGKVYKDLLSGRAYKKNEKLIIKGKEGVILESK